VQGKRRVHPGGHDDVHTYGGIFDDRSHIGQNVRVRQKVNVIEDEDNGGHRFEPAETSGDEGSPEPIGAGTDVLRRRRRGAPDGRERLTQAPGQAMGLVVGSVDGEPGVGLRLGGDPLGQKHRLPISGRSNKERQPSRCRHIELRQQATALHSP